MEIPGVGGAYVKFPPFWGVHIFWKVHILDTLRNKDHLSEVTVNPKTEKTELIVLLAYLKDSNAAAHSVDRDIYFKAVIHLSARCKT